MPVGFLARRDFARGRSDSRMSDALPGEASVAGLETLGIQSIPNCGVERIESMNTAEILTQRRSNCFPMRAAVGRKKNGADATHDPTNLVRRGGAGQ